MTNEKKTQFDDIKEKLYVIEKNGDVYKLDFDNNKGVSRVPVSEDTEGPPTNQKKETSSMEKRKNIPPREDLTNEQYEENYWDTKFDGSTNMMEARISKMQEATGKSREECANEVKKRMKKKEHSENTNTDLIEEEEDEEDEDEEKKGDMAELEAIKAKNEALEAENKKLKGDLDTFKADFSNLKKEWDDKKKADTEAKRQEIIERLSRDFVVPKEEFEHDSLEDLQKTERRLDMAIKREKTEGEQEPQTEDFQAHMDFIEKKKQELDERYIQRI